MVELLVVTCVIGVLVSMAVPNFIGAQDVARNAAVKENMHAAQVCAESYATDSGGTYCATPSGLDPYFPGGGNSVNGGAGYRPRNPFTSATNEALYVETISDTTAVLTTRTSPPSASPGVLGQTGYAPCNGVNAYCVTGTQSGNMRMAGPNNSTLIFSNL
jgi:type II secretory pathway pseudopilin PulG